MMADPDGGWSWVTAAIGAGVGAAAGATYALANDKKGWGWYAAGGAVAGGLIGGASFSQTDKTVYFTGDDVMHSRTVSKLAFDPDGISTLINFTANIGRDAINFGKDQMLHRAFASALKRIADMDAEQEFRERNPNAASRTERVFKHGVKAEDFGLRDDVFGGGTDPMIGSEISYYLQRAGTELTSYWKSDNLQPMISSALFKPGPAIILTGGGGDRFYATFRSIKSRDKFFDVHYGQRYIKRLKQFKGKLK